MRTSEFTRALILGLFITALVFRADAQPPDYVRNAVKAVEIMLTGDDNTAIETFMDKAMIPGTVADRVAFAERLRALRSAVHDLRDDISIEAEPDGVRMILSDGTVEKQIRIVISQKGISDIYLLPPEKPMILNRDNLAETFDTLEATGMAGVVYVRLNGKIILKRAFGMANKELEIPNTLNTVFGTGSRPIDYTVAAIMLLDQQGRIRLDDPVSKYFHDVPEDKQALTIRHLMTGQSGLPDFFHTKDDWDPDLAWVDRETAERRILSQELLFPPGSSRKHSHGAFVLLAALIEHVTGETYYGFIRSHFLDPAGMSRTGEYGESRELSLTDFAEGGGPQFVGLPNIPPNWGPTSWLIKGSGGMYSTLGDLLKFYNYLRSGKVLDEKHNELFRRSTVNVDGSDRGFELFSAYNPPDNEVYLFLNNRGDGRIVRQLFRALERIVEHDE